MKYTTKKGATFRRAFRWTEAGAALDLTGGSVACKISAPGASSSYATLTCTVTDAPAGEFQIEATAAATQAWAVGSYDLDIAATLAGGDVRATNTVTLQVERSPALG